MFQRRKTITCLTLPVTLVYVKLLQNKPKMQLAMRLQKHLALTPIPAMQYAVSGDTDITGIWGSRCWQSRWRCASRHCGEHPGSPRCRLAVAVGVLPPCLQPPSCSKCAPRNSSSWPPLGAWVRKRPQILLAIICHLLRPCARRAECACMLARRCVRDQDGAG
jgi:hypothetical protein